MGESDLQVISLLCYGAASLLYSVGMLTFLGNQVLVSTGCNCVKALETHLVKLFEVQHIAAEHVSTLWSVFCWNSERVGRSARESRCPVGLKLQFIHTAACSMIGCIDLLCVPCFCMWDTTALFAAQ